MSSNEEFYVDGVPISDLRVVDLKEQLEKRGLSKSGSKVVLVKRLKDHLALEKLQESQAGKDPSEAPNSEMKACGNDFVAQYLQQQQQMLQAAKLAAARSAAISGQSPPSATSSTTGSTPGTPDVENRLASPPAGRRSKSTRTKSPRQSVTEQETTVASGASASMVSSPPAEEKTPLPVVAETPELVITKKSKSVASNLLPSFQAEAVTTVLHGSTTHQAEEPQLLNLSGRESEEKRLPEVEETKSGSGEQVAAIVASTTEPEPAAAAMEASPGPASPRESQEKSPEARHHSPPLEEPYRQSPDRSDYLATETGDQSMDNLSRDVEDGGRTEKSSSPSSGVGAHEDGGEESQDDDRGQMDIDLTSTIQVALPIDEPDDVEMEISAPINAADELFEAVNSTVSTTSSSGGKKMELERQESAPVAPENRDIPQRKRKWVASTLPKRAAVSISTDSLKDIVGSVTDSVIEEESKQMIVEDSKGSPIPKRIVISRDVSVADSSTDIDTDVSPTRLVEIDAARPPMKMTEEGFVRLSTPSPARHPPSNIIHIRGLTRPFTLPALHELLSKFGDFSKEDFWIDNIKSHCIVKYSDESAGVLARERLHNVQWPTSNTKSLRVDFASEEDFERHRNKEGPAARLSRQNTENEKDRQGDAPERVVREVREVRTSDREDRGRRSASPRRPDLDRSWDRGKNWRTGESPPNDPRGAGIRRRSQSPERRGIDAKQDQPAPAGKLLDELFRKTKATPCIYWLPLSLDQIRDKERDRKKREQERFERVKKMEEEERERERRRETYRRHSPVDYRNRRR